MRLRVEELAARADVAVDTIRFYRSRGLLPPPEREGRIAWYGQSHVERLAEIKRLQGLGLTLATIGRILSGELDAADAALAAATVSAEAEAEDGPLTLAEVAERSGVPMALLQLAEQTGLLTPPRVDGGPQYSTADVEAAASAMSLLELGLPLDELLALARRHHDAVRSVAEGAVALFDDHIRHPLRDSGLPEDEAAARLVEAFEKVLPATVAIVTHHFRRTLLAVAQEHLERVDPAAFGRLAAL
jgi:DNA-binding transcriptional MerR regulator